MRVAIHLAAAASLLVGLDACSGGVLDLGGDPAEAGEAAESPASDVTAFSAAAVRSAKDLCAPIPPGNPVTSYPPAVLQNRLVGGWVLCHYEATQGARSFQFTADGHWYTLVDDGLGGLKRGSVQPNPEYNGVVIGQEGTYTFKNDTGADTGPGDRAVWVATQNVPWFHPEFAPRLMTMTFADLSQDICALIVP